MFLQSTENLQSRLIDVEKECVSDEEKTTCMSQKINDIRAQTDDCKETVEKLDNRAKKLHDFYVEKINNFRKRMNEIIGKVSSCVHNHSH